MLFRATYSPGDAVVITEAFMCAVMDIKRAFGTIVSGPLLISENKLMADRNAISHIFQQAMGDEPIEHPKHYYIVEALTANGDAIAISCMPYELASMWLEAEAV